MLVGEHDFRAFTPTDTQHQVFVRHVEDARWYDRGDTVEFEIRADSFLRHMVRTLVGTMLEQDPDALLGLLARRAALGGGLDGPACGLYLVAVGYDGRQASHRFRPACRPAGAPASTSQGCSRHAPAGSARRARALIGRRRR